MLILDIKIKNHILSPQYLTLIYKSAILEIGSLTNSSLLANADVAKTILSKLIIVLIPRMKFDKNQKETLTKFYQKLAKIIKILN